MVQEILKPKQTEPTTSESATGLASLVHEQSGDPDRRSLHGQSGFHEAARSGLTVVLRSCWKEGWM